MQLPTRPNTPARLARQFAATIAIGLLAGHAHWALAQQPGPPPNPVPGPPPGQATPNSPASAVLPPQARAKPTGRQQVKAEARPTWAELTPEQQQALGPLAGTWSTLSEGHKRKWLALSQNYPKMPPEEQDKLRGRMIEWAALTPQQRTQARLNFAESRKLPATDKKAMWEAYQALPPEEKRRLAASASVSKPPPPPISAAVRPVPPQRLASTPKAPKTDAPAPRIAVVPASAGAAPAAPAAAVAAPAAPIPAAPASR